MFKYDLIYIISINAQTTTSDVQELIKNEYKNKILIFTDDAKGLEPLYGTKNLQIVIPIIDKSIPKSQWSNHIQCYLKPYKNVLYYKHHIKDKYFHEHLDKYESILNNVTDSNPNWHEYFKNIVVISKYDINSEELRNIKLIKEHKNITIQKFDAIYPKESHSAFPKIGYYGCALSHYNVIKLAKQNNWNNVMILEDDVVLHKQFNHYMNEIIDELKTIEWDMLYCKYNNIVKEQVHFIKKYKKIIQQTGILGCECVCINNLCYDYILKNYEKIFNFKTSSYDNTIDRWYNKQINLKKFILYKNLCCQLCRIDRESILNIEYTHEFLNEKYIDIIEYLKNKNIAVVSNSANLLNSEYGNDIDNNDFVIRFNKFTCDSKFIKNVGSKTNGYCFFSAECDTSIYNGNNYEYNWITYNKNPIIPNNIKTNFKLLYLSLISPGKAKTSGLAMIEWLVNNIEFKQLNLYGFCGGDAKESAHYFENSKIHEHHSLNMEIPIIYDIIKLNSKINLYK